MTDLRKAAEMALEALELGDDISAEQMSDALEALRQALNVDAVNMSQECVDETAKCVHEPFIYVREDNERPFGGYEHCSEADAGAFPVYTAPPKHEWVGLTDEEVHEVVSKKWWDWEDAFDIEGFSRAIEAKLKEKNGG